MTISIGKAWNTFMKSKNYVSKESCFEKWHNDPSWFLSGDDDDVKGVFMYVFNCYIEVINDGYMLTIENDSWVDKDILVLENILFTEWVIPNQFIDLSGGNENGYR